MIWTLKQLSEALSVSLNQIDSHNFGKVQFNSLDVQTGDLFIALKGQRDGHEFVNDAIARGASAAIVSRQLEDISASKLIYVDDCYVALEKLAKYKRQNSKAKFIAITGTAGKTSTKEAIFLMLQTYGKTFASRGNFNNYLGMLINLASMPDDIDFAVIEIGMSEAGQISNITALVKPDIAMITSVAEGHLEFFKSVNEIADAKSEIFESLNPKTGIAIINQDIPTFARCMDKIYKLGINNVKTFGQHEISNYQLAEYNFTDEQVKIKYKLQNQQIDVTRSLLPRHMAVNFAGCFAIIDNLNLSLTKSIEAFMHFELQVGRGKLVKISNNNYNYSIICDYYNANPISMKSSLILLSQLRNNKKVAVIGDMRELGTKSLQLHKSIVPYIVESDIHLLFLVGDEIQQIKDDLPSQMEHYCYNNVHDLIPHIKKYIQNDQLWLIKGSRGVNLEKIAEALGVEDDL